MLAFVQRSFSQKGFAELVKIVVEFSDINSKGERDLGKSLQGQDWGGEETGGLERKPGLTIQQGMEVKEEKGNCIQYQFCTF